MKKWRPRILRYANADQSQIWEKLTQLTAETNLYSCSNRKLLPGPFYQPVEIIVVRFGYDVTYRRLILPSLTGCLSGEGHPLPVETSDFLNTPITFAHVRMSDDLLFGWITTGVMNRSKTKVRTILSDNFPLPVPLNKIIRNQCNSNLLETCTYHARWLTRWNKTK